MFKEISGDKLINSGFGQYMVNLRLMVEREKTYNLIKNTYLLFIWVFKKNISFWAMKI